MIVPLPRLRPCLSLLAIGLCVSPAAGMSSQAGDSLEILAGAREAQAAFERERLRNAPTARGSWGGDCDEIVGRMCLRLRETGDWWPESPDPADVAARERLLDRLRRAGEALPGDLWILAQRTYYLWEAGRPEAALPLLEPCRVSPAWWCDALRGYALHRAHRFPEAEEAFERALDHMPTGDDGFWRDPRLVVDRDGREALDRAGEDWDVLVRRLWALSDPLFLVPGNDRWTEHMARRVQEFMHEDARNGYGLRWGSDLAETLVRYGPEIGWEERRPPPGAVAATSDGIGHQHPELRSLVAPGRAMWALTATEPREWNPGDRFLPRSGYAPSYAPVILPAPGSMHVIPRGDRLTVVADIALPADTSYHRGHEHPPLPRPEDLVRDETIRYGLFATDPEGRVLARAEGPDGRLAIHLPPGPYLLSAEVWAPDSLLAGRIRRGLAWDGVPPDVPVISDLLLADPPAAEPGSLEAVLPHLRTGLRAERVAPGETILVAWELHGLGWRPEEPLRYELGFQEAGEGFFRRAGRFLGLVGDPWTQDLRWAEDGPTSPGPSFRATRLTLPPDMDEGTYLIRVQVGLEGRETLVAERAVRVLHDPGSR